MRNIIELALFTFFAFAAAAVTSIPPSSQLKYLSSEIKYLASLKHRLTGSASHNQLIDHIHSELDTLNLVVNTDTLEFTYFDGPLSSPAIRVNGKEVPVTSYSKYSGFTNSDGVTGRLVDLTTSSLTEQPDWSKAVGNIALVNITNLANDLSKTIAVWPESPPWFVEQGSPDASATSIISSNLTHAAQAGVKAVIYAWQNASTGMIEGTWSPFRNLYQGVPTLFVQGEYGGLEKLRKAASAGETATVTLHANMRPNTARTLWVKIDGTRFPNESMIINTHTDGTNVIEENGYIPLLAYAALLVKYPPERTVILVFLGQHMHFNAFTPLPQRATSRWLQMHPELWAGGNSNNNDFQFGGQLKGVVGSCAEHLGAVHWREDLKSNKWYSTEKLEAEILYASTPRLNKLLRQHWVGANPNVTRVSNPNDKSVQIGEGYPLYLVDIPNISLATYPAYLIKLWADDFDQENLVNLKAFQRQVESFLRIWQIMDKTSSDDFT